MRNDARASRKKTVTMRDVARAANVSQSTVSRVLNESTRGIPISEETKHRVLSAVERLGYHPNLHAGSLRGQKTRMLAMMVADIANPFYHPMVRAVQDVARLHEYDVMVANTDHTRDGEVHFCESLIRRPVDGVVLTPYYLTDEDIGRLIERTGVAVSALGQHVNHPEVDVVYGDDEAAVVELTTWLCVEKQHDRIGYIGVTNKHAAGFRRRQAFSQTLADRGLEMPPAYFQEGDWTVASGIAAMEKLLDLSNPPTAVFALNDLMAIGAMEVAKKRGIRIPEDLGIVGFDDIPAASWISPKLTTVTQFPREIGRIMAEMVFERLAGSEGSGCRHMVACRLVKRKSA
jgi:LacI family transcriptional regulator